MKKNLPHILTANFLFWVTATFFIPLAIFLNNRIEFPGTLGVVLIQTVCTTILATLLFTFLSFLFPARKHPLIISILVTLTSLLWIQSNLIVVNSGLLDGHTINWDQYSLYGLPDLLLWIGLLIVAVKFRHIISKNAFSIAGILITIQIISSVVTFAYSSTDLEFKNYITDDSTKFTFSEKKNVILIVLDTFQTNYFNNALKEHPEYTDQLTGFTYYPNATAGFNSTYPSVPLILTGQYYDNSKPIQEFITNAFAASSLPKFFKEHGFKSDFYPLVNQAIALNPNFIDNILPSWETLSTLGDRKEISALSYLTWFRALPQYLKPDIGKVEEAVLSTSLVKPEHEMINFLKSLRDEIKVSDIQEQFKFYHLLGLHPPLTTNEDLGYEPMTFTPQNYARAAEGSLKMINELVTILKNSHVYDQSMIVIVGDHGAGMPLDMTPNKSLVTESIRSRGQPLFLIKPFQSHTNLVVKNTPVSLADIYKTIAASIDAKKATTISGLDILNELIPTDRIRQYFFYDWTTAIWTTSHSYLPPMRKYTISGQASAPESWNDTREIYQNGTVSTFNANYTLNTIIDFSKKEAAKYKAGGWSYAESAGTWTLGSNAVIELNQLPKSSDLILDIDMMPFQNQHVDISINDHHLDEIALSQSTKYKVIIPSQFIKGTQDLIDLAISSPKSPVELGISPDERQIGLLVSSMKLSMAPKYIIGEPVNFTAKDFNADQWTTSGWSVPELDGTWTLGMRADMSIPLQTVAHNKLVLQTNLTPLISPPSLSSQKVQVEINDQKIGEWNVDHTGDYTLPIPASILTSDHLHIVFSIPNATSPAALTHSADTRKLGVLFKNLNIFNAES